MGDHGHLQPAAQGRAVDRGDHRLGRILDHQLQVAQRWLHRWLAQFGDVGAGEEGPAPTIT